MILVMGEIEKKNEVKNYVDEWCGVVELSTHTHTPYVKL